MIFRINAIIAYNDGSDSSFTSLFDQTLQKYPEGDYTTQEAELFSWPEFRAVWPDATFTDPIDVSHIADITFFVGSMNDDQEVVEAFGGESYGEGQAIESLEGQEALQTYVEEFEEPYVPPLNPPEPAMNKAPADESEFETDPETGFANVPFLWWPALGATSYDFHLGTVSPPPFEVNTTELGITVGLPPGVYYWRVNSRNDDGTTEGPVIWSFTVVDAAP